MATRVFLCLLVLLTMTGCASQISAWLNRDIRTDTVKIRDPDGPKHRHTVISTTGERRIVFFSEKGRICPENFPDASRSFTAKSDIEVKDISSKDSIETKLEKTNDRKESADLVGRLGAIVCVAYLNDVLNDCEYAELIKTLVNESMAYLKKRAESPHETKGAESSHETKGAESSCE